MKAATRASSRLDILLSSSAKLFASKGYQATTMRDIAKKCGMLPGSIYYHYPNKEALLVAVYEEGVRQLTDRVEAAISTSAEPWARLELMIVTHIQMIIEPTAYANVIIRILPDDVPSVRAELIELRDNYETLLRDLIAALPLHDGSDRRLMRLFLIGAINHIHVWHKPGGTRPAEIAKELLHVFRGAATPPVEGAAR